MGVAGLGAPENVVEWNRPPSLGGIVILRGTNCTRGFDVFHNSYDVCEMRRGACDYFYRGSKRLGQAHTLQLFEPGETHRTPRVIHAGTIRVLHLPASILETYAQELGVPSQALHWKNFAIAQPDIFRAVERFHDSLETTSTTLERQSRLTGCVEAILRASAERSPPSSPNSQEPVPLRRARELLLERFAEDLSLDDLAVVAGLSRFRFLHAFRARYGYPPHAYLVRVRLTEARRLLENGESPALAAAATGFFDQSHLTRYFKLAWRVTPGEYAKAVRGLR